MDGVIAGMRAYLHRSRILGVVVLSAGALVSSEGQRAMAQTAEMVQPAAPAKTAQSGWDVLSDTMGVDFGPYLRRLHNDIQRNWNPLIPYEVVAPPKLAGVVTIRFSILPDGRIGTMKLESPSGKVALDKAAWMAITSEGQFPALPAAFHGPLLDLRVRFSYNMSAPENVLPQVTAPPR